MTDFVEEAMSSYGAVPAEELSVLHWMTTTAGCVATSERSSAAARERGLTRFVAETLHDSLATALRLGIEHDLRYSGNERERRACTTGNRHDESPGGREV